MLYTDGIVESRSDSGEEFGYERLLESLGRHRHEDVEVLHERLLDDLHVFLGHRQYDDDLTLLIMKWSGVAPKDRKADVQVEDRGMGRLHDVKSTQAADTR